MPPRPFTIAEHYRRLASQLLARSELCGSLLNHGTLLGDESENIVRDFLRSVLPNDVGVATGQIVSSTGMVSPQIDVLVYHPIRNAVVGASESGKALIRAESLIAMVEAKRSIGINTIREAAAQLAQFRSFMLSIKHETNWLQWIFSFSSAKSPNSIVSELGKHCCSADAAGRLVVLNCGYAASELQSIATKTGAGGTAGPLSGAALRRLARALGGPHTVLFNWEQSKCEVDVTTSPLLEFVTQLEMYAERSGSPGRLSPLDFDRS